MAGSLLGVMVAGLLAAAPAGDFSFQSIEASARTTAPAGYFAQGSTPYPNLYERGSGSATLTAEDRVNAPGATYGDKARLEAQFRLGGTEYRVALEQAGFPPVQGANGSVVPSASPRPGYPVEGGVMLDRDLNGNSGLGWPASTRVHTAISVWGVGSVWRDGQLLTDAAVIQANALSHGANTDDESHQPLPVAREGDTEFEVLAWNLPPSAEPRGFIQFSFEDVAIEIGGRSVKSVAVLPNVMGADSIGPMAVFGGVGQNGTLVPQTTPPPQAQGTGGAGFDFAAAPVTGTPGGPVTPVSPGTLGGPLSPNPLSIPGVSVGTEATRVGTAAPGVPGVPGQPITGPVTPATTVGPGAVTPDTISGVFPTTGAPTPAANISGYMPGTAAPGSTLAEQSPIPAGAPPPGGAAESGVALPRTPPTLSSAGTFTVPISPPNFTNFAGTSQVSPGIIATAPPINSDRTIPTPPLLGSPAPLTAAPATPLLGTPAPLTIAPPPTLITTPSPGNVTPGAATSGSVTSGTTLVTPPTSTPATPGGTGVPPSI